MPTAQDWLNALTVPREVRINSSQALINAVQQRQQSRSADAQRRGKQPPVFKGPLTTVPQFDPHAAINVVPLTLLHALGETTTPPIPNLASLSATWASWRYIWAFSLPRARPDRMRLSRIAKSIDFHQKGLLSDEIGVGMAAYLMSNYFGTPRSIDISIAVRSRRFPVIQALSTSPDYLFFDTTRQTMYVVECKGCQTSRSAALNQVRRGTEQVPSITLANGNPIPSFVIATFLNRRQTEVLLLDPPGDNEELFPDADPVSEKNERVRKLDETTYQVLNDPEFFETMEDVNAAKVLAFAGDEIAAVQKLQEELPLERIRFMPRQRPNARAETEFGDFIGVSQRVETRDQASVEIFRGVDVQLREAYAGRENEAIRARLAEFQARKIQQAPQPGYINTVIETQDGFRARSISASGSMLEYRIGYQG